MKFFRRILKHIFLLAFIVLLGAVYYFRHELFPGFMAKYGDEMESKIVSMVKIGEAEKSPPAVSGESTERPAEVEAPASASGSGEADQPSEPAAATPAQDSDAAPPATQSDTDADVDSGQPESVPVPVATSDQDQPEVAEPAISAPPTAMPPAPATPMQMGRGAAMAPPSVQRTDAAPALPQANVQADSAQAALMDARSAYWKREYATAESKYQELAQTQPDNPNAHGELGNVYYAQGKWKLAAASFAQAAEMLHKQGHRGRAAYLHRIIQGLDAEQASELAGKLRQTPGDVDQ